MDRKEVADIKAACAASDIEMYISGGYRREGLDIRSRTRLETGEGGGGAEHRAGKGVPPYRCAQLLGINYRGVVQLRCAGE